MPSAFRDLPIEDQLVQCVAPPRKRPSDQQARAIVREVLEFATEDRIADRRWHATAQGVTEEQWLVTLARFGRDDWAQIGAVRAQWVAAELAPQPATPEPVIVHRVGGVIRSAEKFAAVKALRDAGATFTEAERASPLPRATFARYWRAAG